MAAQAIEALGVNPEQIRARVGAGPRPDPVAEPENIPFAPPARTAFEQGLREALRRGHSYIGTEHLLLGILADEEGAAAAILTDFGITRKRAQGWINQAPAS